MAASVFVDGDPGIIRREQRGQKIVQRRAPLAVGGTGEMGGADRAGARSGERQRPAGETARRSASAERMERDHRPADEIVAGWRQAGAETDEDCRRLARRGGAAGEKLAERSDGGGGKAQQRRVRRRNLRSPVASPCQSRDERRETAGAADIPRRRGQRRQPGGEARAIPARRRRARPPRRRVGQGEGETAGDPKDHAVG